MGKNDSDKKPILTEKYIYKEHPDYILLAKQTGFEVDSIHYSIPFTLFDITLELEAKKDSLPGIYLMTCSWGGQNAFVNDSNFVCGYHGCDANYMSIVTIKSNEVLELKTVVLLKPEVVNFQNKIRIALIAIDTADVPYGTFISRITTMHDPMISAKLEEEFDSAYDSLKRLPKNWIWSNEIELKEMDVKGDLWGSYEVKKLSERSILP